MVNHQGVTNGNFWAPPGGGIQFGESAADCLRREFVEETGLSIEPKDFLFACEFIKPPLHAIELFFEVTALTHDLTLGNDPEPGSPQLIKELKFMSWNEIASLPPTEVHGIFRHLAHPAGIINLRGYFEKRCNFRVNPRKFFYYCNR